MYRHLFKVSQLSHTLRLLDYVCHPCQALQHAAAAPSLACRHGAASGQSGGRQFNKQASKHAKGSHGSAAVPSPWLMLPAKAAPLQAAFASALTFQGAAGVGAPAVYCS